MERRRLPEGERFLAIRGARALAGGDLELEVTGMVRRGGRAQRGAKTMTESAGVGGEKDWAGLSF